MSLYRKPGSQVWWMNIYRGKGLKRVQRSTGKTVREEAAIIEQSFIALNKGKTNRARLMKIVDVVCPEEVQGMRLEELGAFFEACVKDEHMRMSDKTHQEYTSLCGRLSEWARANTHISLVEELTVPLAWQFSEELARGGCKTKRRNDNITKLQKVWDLLIKRARANENPWKTAKVQRNHDEDLHGRPFTPEEIARIHAAEKEVGFEWDIVGQIGEDTGVRLSDAKGMLWEEVDLENGWLHIKPKKTMRHGITVDMPMTKRLREMLTELKARAASEGRARPKDFVTPFRAKHKNDRFHHGDMSYPRIIAKAGIVGKDKEKLSFHCWRHTFDTRLSEAGVDQETRMALTGHTNKKTETIYNSDRQRLVKAVAALGV